MMGNEARKKSRPKRLPLLAAPLEFAARPWNQRRWGKRSKTTSRESRGLPLGRVVYLGPLVSGSIATWLAFVKRTPNK